MGVEKAKPRNLMNMQNESFRNSDLEVGDYQLVDKLRDEDQEVSGFELSPGPTPQCFSPVGMISLFQSGASDEDAEHILQCHSCQERLQRFSELTTKQLKVASVSTGFFRRMFPSQGAQSTEVRGRAAVVYSRDKVLSVDNERLNPGRFNCSILVPGAGSADEEVDMDSVRLTGLVEASRPTVVKIELFGRKVSTYAFGELTLPVEERRILAEQAAVRGSVCLEGRFKDGAKMGFFGSMLVELRNKQPR